MKWSKKTNRLMSMKDSVWFRSLSIRNKVDFINELIASMEEDKSMHRAAIRQSILEELKKQGELPSIDQMQEQIRKWEWQMLTEFSPSSFSPNLKSNTMNIEVGKFYKTRNGCKVRIYATDGEIHGAIFLGNEWLIRTWCADGSFMKILTHDSDIVSEWEEPLDFDWNCLPAWADGIFKANSHSDGTWFYYAGKEPNFMEDSLNGWEVSSCTNYDRIPKKFAPKNYKGSIKDSIHKRPTSCC